MSVISYCLIAIPSCYYCSYYYHHRKHKKILLAFEERKKHHVSELFSFQFCAYLKLRITEICTASMAAARLTVQTCYPKSEFFISFCHTSFCTPVPNLLVILTLYWLPTFSFQWQPTPVLLPGESHGCRSLVGCCLWGRTESDTTEAT